MVQFLNSISHIRQRNTSKAVFGSSNLVSFHSKRQSRTATSIISYFSHWFYIYIYISSWKILHIHININLTIFLHAHLPNNSLTKHLSFDFNPNNRIISTFSKKIISFSLQNIRKVCYMKNNWTFGHVSRSIRKA